LVTASFSCNQSTLEEFRMAVMGKHKKLYGVLAEEFEQALKDRTKLLQKEVKK
jgi:hypothetical protein